MQLSVFLHLLLLIFSKFVIGAYDCLNCNGISESWNGYSVRYICTDKCSFSRFSSNNGQIDCGCSNGNSCSKCLNVSETTCSCSSCCGTDYNYGPNGATGWTDLTGDYSRNWTKYHICPRNTYVTNFVFYSTSVGVTDFAITCSDNTLIGNYFTGSFGSNSGQVTSTAGFLSVGVAITGSTIRNIALTDVYGGKGYANSISISQWPSPAQCSSDQRVTGLAISNNNYGNEIINMKMFCGPNIQPVTSSALTTYQTSSTTDLCRKYVKNGDCGGNKNIPVLITNRFQFQDCSGANFIYGRSLLTRTSCHWNSQNNNYQYYACDATGSKVIRYVCTSDCDDCSINDWNESICNGDGLSYQCGSGGIDIHAGDISEVIMVTFNSSNCQKEQTIGYEVTSPTFCAETISNQYGSSYRCDDSQFYYLSSCSSDCGYECQRHNISDMEECYYDTKTGLSSKYFCGYDYTQPISANSSVKRSQWISLLLVYVVLLTL